VPAGPTSTCTQARVRVDGARICTDRVLPRADVVKTRPQIKLCPGGKNGQTRSSRQWKWTDGQNGRPDGHFYPKTSVMTTLCTGCTGGWCGFKFPNEDDEQMKMKDVVRSSTIWDLWYIKCATWVSNLELVVAGHEVNGFSNQINVICSCCSVKIMQRWQEAVVCRGHRSHFLSMTNRIELYKQLRNDYVNISSDSHFLIIYEVNDC
jgi:hypothetical protein